MGIFQSAEEKERRRREKEAIREKASTLIATTADLKKEYEIVEILTAQSLSELKIKAARLDAEAIVGIGFFSLDNLCYGTAVRFTASENKDMVEEKSAHNPDNEKETEEQSDQPTSE